MSGKVWHVGTSISLYYFRNGKSNDLILEIKHLLTISIGKRLTIKNAFQRAYSTNLENISVHLVIKIEKFWKSNSSVIWEIKRHKFWKSKVSIEKSNATNFGNQKCHLRNQTRQILEIKRVKFWKSKMHLRNQTRKTLEIKIVIREIKRDKFKIKMTQ